MKLKNPGNGSIQSASEHPSKTFSGAYEPGARHHYYRSVILAVSGSLFCVAAGEQVAAQSASDTPRSLGQTVADSAQASPPTFFGGLEVVERGQSQLPSASWICSDLQTSATMWDNSQLWHPGEQLEYFAWVQSRETAGNSAAAPATPVPAPAEAPVPAASTPAIDANAAAPGATPVSPDPNATAPVSATAPGAVADASTPLGLPGMPLPQPTVYKNELSASADFMYGRGTITVPIGYALRNASAAFPVNAVSADRSTVYYGGTVSYSFGRSWYLDVSGENGRSTGSTSISIPNLSQPGTFPASFNVNDTWYQAYLRYNFKNFLAGSRFRAYLRGGVSLVNATLDTVNSSFSSGQHFGAGDFYSEHDKTFDVLGNLGFGLTYSLYSTVRLKMGLQMEGEGFGGNRSQDITETFVPSPSLSGKTTINDTVYGAIGRLTLHADYRLGETGRWKMTGDIGMMTKYSFVSYPDFGTKEELLYGPYAKVGVSFVF